MLDCLRKELRTCQAQTSGAGWRWESTRALRVQMARVPGCQSVCGSFLCIPNRLTVFSFFPLNLPWEKWGQGEWQMELRFYPGVCGCASKKSRFWSPWNLLQNWASFVSSEQRVFILKGVHDPNMPRTTMVKIESSFTFCGGTGFSSRFESDNCHSCHFLLPTFLLMPDVVLKNCAPLESKFLRKA